MTPWTSNRLLVEVTALAREAGRAILEVYASTFTRRRRRKIARR